MTSFAGFLDMQAAAAGVTDAATIAATSATRAIRLAMVDKVHMAFRSLLHPIRLRRLLIKPAHGGLSQPSFDAKTAECGGL